MDNIQNQPFWKKLNSGIKGSINTLITRTRTIKIYKEAQLKGSIIGLLVFFIYYFLTTGNHSFNGVFESYEFYIAVIGIGGYFALLEKMMEPLQKETKKLTETIGTKMVLKICNCDGYCECKENLNNYMKAEKGITII